MWAVWLTRISRMTFKGWCRTALKAVCTKQREGQVLAQKPIPPKNNEEEIIAIIFRSHSKE